ncbi:hypothetical protein [Streptomyces spongiae]|uniref:hypothetical protein n=1 Tax=Streptomyces spongiae TaxID=565072 RepID=UPI00128D12ED|nr:hypothetical protein [Streptomyces spongiae]
MDKPFPVPPGDAHRSAWSVLDEYLWHTCDILADFVEGRLDQRPLVATSAKLEPGDRALASGPAQRLTWRALGDGTFTQSDLVAFGDTTFVLSSMVGNALGNAARRRSAALNAQPRWVPDGTGEIALTLRKIHFVHPVCGIELGWTSLETIDLVAPDIFQASFPNDRTENGVPHIIMQFQTPWASLLFVLAALAGFPAHPRLLGRGWLPSDFEQRCVILGRPLRPTTQLVLNMGTGGPGSGQHNPS